MTMRRLGLALGYSGQNLSIDFDLIQAAESAGFDSVWTAEAYGSDAVSPLAWIGAKTSKIRLGTAIMQLPARSPASTAMTAMTLDALSGGRFILGLGTSGPQVVEGWHGVPFGKPLTWLREYVTVVRTILEREKKLEFDGERYQIPYRGAGATGLGKPLKSILHGRKDIPIYTGSMAPKSQELSAEIADGILLTTLHPGRFEVTEENLRAGFAKSTRHKDLSTFDVAPFVACIVGTDLDACRAPLKANLALYVGGMGARDKNFYNAYMRKVGFEEAAARIQDLFLAGKKEEAAAAVPDEMVDAFNLVGPPERIRERYKAWKDLPIGTMIVAARQVEAVNLMAELAAP
jgi:F420-dependent oxidoreductase-like protein